MSADRMTHGDAYVAAYVAEWAAWTGEPVADPPECVASVGRMLDAVQLDGMTYHQAQQHGREAAREDYARDDEGGTAAA